MRIDIRTHLDLFDLLGLLALFVRRLFLLGFEPHFSVIEDFTDRKIGIRCHFYQIQASCACSRDRFADIDGASFFTGFCNEKDFGRCNIIVDARAFL